MMIPVIVVFAILVATAVVAWRDNPTNRRNIDRNLRKIVNGKPGTIVTIKHAPSELQSLYTGEFKGYPGIIECDWDSKETTTLVLTRVR